MTQKIDDFEWSLRTIVAKRYVVGGRDGTVWYGDGDFL